MGIPFEIVKDETVRETVRSQSRNSAIWAELNQALADGEMIFVPTKDATERQRIQNRYSNTPSALKAVGLKTKTRRADDGVFVFTEPDISSESAKAVSR